MHQQLLDFIRTHEDAESEFFIKVCMKHPRLVMSVVFKHRSTAEFLLSVSLSDPEFVLSVLKEKDKEANAINDLKYLRTRLKVGPHNAAAKLMADEKDVEEDEAHGRIKDMLKSVGLDDEFKLHAAVCLCIVPNASFAEFEGEMRNHGFKGDSQQMETLYCSTKDFLSTYAHYLKDGE